MLFDMIAQQYNEQAARPVADIIHVRLQVAVVEQHKATAAASPLRLLQAAAAHAAANSARLGERSAGTTAAADGAAQAAAAAGASKAGPSTAKPPLTPRGGGSPLRTMQRMVQSTMSSLFSKVQGPATTPPANNKAATSGGNRSSAAGVSANSSCGAAGAAEGSGASLAGSGAAIAGGVPSAVGGSSLAAVAGSGSGSGSRTNSTAAAAGTSSALQEQGLLRLDPFDKRGFALKALNSQFAVDYCYDQAGKKYPTCEHSMLVMCEKESP
jgi:hypothetical protein